jgi:hypothetical protein
MKIIDECPICKKDFMYDPNVDVHLIRSNMPLNAGTLGLSEEDLEDHDVTYFICQECHIEE